MFRPAPEASRRIFDSIMQCTALFDAVVTRARDRMPVLVAALRDELVTEQRKLIMAHRADLLAELDRRVLRLHGAQA